MKYPEQPQVGTCWGDRRQWGRMDEREKIGHIVDVKLQVRSYQLLNISEKDGLILCQKSRRPFGIRQKRANLGMTEPGR